MYVWSEAFGVEKGQGKGFYGMSSEKQALDEAATEVRLGGPTGCVGHRLSKKSWFSLYGKDD